MIVLTGKKVRLVLDRNKPNNLEVFLLWTLDFYFKLGITQGRGTVINDQAFFL